MANGRPLPKEKDKKIKSHPLRWWKKKADKIFSEYIRRRNADVDGMVVCYTCGRKAHWKQMQNGHFVPRQYLATRYSEVNCQVQDYACNMLYNGQPSAFALNLKRDYGNKIISELEKSRQKSIQLSQLDYEKIINHYSRKLG